MTASHTVERLRAAGAARRFAQVDLDAWCDAFEALQAERLALNARQLAAGAPQDNHLDPRKVDAPTERRLRMALQATRGLQARLARDFGVAGAGFGA